MYKRRLSCMARGQDVFAFHPGLSRLRVYLLANLERHIPLADAARVAGVEKHYLCVLFRRDVGLSYADWAASVRVDHAKRLLRRTDHTISEIAARVGFNCLRTFERRFQRHATETPSQYRERRPTSAVDWR